MASTLLPYFCISVGGACGSGDVTLYHVESDSNNVFIVKYHHVNFSNRLLGNICLTVTIAAPWLYLFLDRLVECKLVH